MQSALTPDSGNVSMHLASLGEPSCRTETRRRLRSFSEQVVRRWGSLSPGGAMCHLAMCYEMVVENKPCSERTGPLQRTVLKFGALHVPLQWPRGYQTLPELVEGATGVCAGDFAADRTRLMDAFDRFAAAQVIAGRAHPIFGPLTHWEWMRWGYLHADHHLRQFGL